MSNVDLLSRIATEKADFTSEQSSIDTETPSDAKSCYSWSSFPLIVRKLSKMQAITPFIQEKHIPPLM